VKTEYKETPIGKIPKDWEVVGLGDKNVTDLIMGQSPPSSTYNKKGIGLPFLQGNAEFGETYPRITWYCSKPLKIAEKKDILLSVRAPVGELNISISKTCIGRGISAIRPRKDKIDYLFLFYYLKSCKNRFEKLSMGSTFKAIRKSEIENYLIPLPPLPEQKAIASILSTVDDAIQKVDSTIEKTERLKRGLMQNLLTNPDFKPIKLKYVGKISTGKTPSTKKEKYWENGTVPFVTPGDLEKSNYVEKTKRYITKEAVKEANGFLPKNSVMVVCIGSTIGKVGMNKIECVTNQQINSIVCNSNYDPSYVYYQILLKSKFLRAFSGVAAVPIIKKSLFENFEIPIPFLDNPEKSIKEQQKIAEILSTVDKKLELERNRKEKLERIKKGLMNDLLTGKKRVKVS